MSGFMASKTGKNTGRSSERKLIRDCKSNQSIVSESIMESIKGNGIRDMAMGD
jgi:hypothetical protein